MPNGDRDPARDEPEVSPECVRANQALECMIEALSLIDANDGPGDAGAYLDHAIHRLREWIEKSAAT